MRLKLVLLVIVIVLLSGCNAEYNLNIREDKSSVENLIIKNYTDYYSEDDIYTVLPKDLFDTEGASIDFDDSNHLVISRYKDSYLKLNKDKEIDNYFGKLKVDSGKISFKPNYDTCIFMFSDGGEYVTDNKVRVNVKIPFKVLESNADEVNDDTYTWIYGVNDCKKEVYIRVKYSYMIVFFLVIAFIIGVVAAYIIIKRKRLNEF